MQTDQLNKIINFRRELHQFPELSGYEEGTATRICKFIRNFSDARVVEGLGGCGLALVHTFSDEGPTVMIRCELDALPIHEVNSFEHRSTVNGVSHKCGHDGHMAIVVGLAWWLSEQSFKRGQVILLFQPAEETGQGAASVIADPKYEKLQPDYVFALHNIPGEPLHTVICVDPVSLFTEHHMHRGQYSKVIIFNMVISKSMKCLVNLRHR